MQVDASRLIAALARQWPDCLERLERLRLAGALRLGVDSRQVQPGDVFIATPGVAADGRDFIPAALDAGARLVLCHRQAVERPGDRPAEPGDARVVPLEGLREHLGDVGRELFGVPEDLEVIGVTGTNGKSSVTHYLAELSQSLGVATGVVGTLGHGPPGEMRVGGLTTPGALALQAVLGELAAQGLRRVAMEVSSHALDQGRLEGCRMTAAVFTNLTRDHLDYHGSMAAYAAAKACLFRRPELSLAVVNGDDPLARLMLSGLSPGVRVLATGEDEAVTLRVIDWQPHETGQRALVATPEGERAIDLPLMGRFNLDNILLAIATLHGFGHALADLFTAASDLTAVPGRMQALIRPGCPTVVIDYAHTPDALDSALKALRAHLPGSGRLWCLFGCGGDRDPGKRPLMAATAQRHADVLVITDDNPRSESPGGIREQILAGLSVEARASTLSLSGRGEAIARVLAEAAAEDVILIAGKGHETYQEIQGVRHDFSDLVEVEKAIVKRSGEKAWERDA